MGPRLPRRENQQRLRDHDPVSCSPPSRSHSEELKVKCHLTNHNTHGLILFFPRYLSNLLTVMKQTELRDSHEDGGSGDHDLDLGVEAKSSTLNGKSGGFGWGSIRPGSVHSPSGGVLNTSSSKSSSLSRSMISAGVHHQVCSLA